MLESWRWFGPLDKISLPQIAQTGARGIVTALHEIPYGEVWSREAIAERKGVIEGAGGGMRWAVVESLPLHEDIKRGSGDLSGLFAAYRQSLANLAAEGVRTVCYNFMPVLDWTRTQLREPLPFGGSALRFSEVEMAAFELFMLRREGAESDYSAAVIAEAEAWSAAADGAERARLLDAIMAGLPGAYSRYDVEQLRAVLSAWAGFSADDLRASFKRFLAEVGPAAEELGMRLCVHPDDPPRPLLGLPRIVSCAEDIEFVLSAYDSDANGLTLCSGSLGAGARNDVPAIARRFASRIHFAHLRNVAREANGSFQEAAHLEGDTDMPALIDALLSEEARRRAAGRADHEIPFRPDHGHELLGDELVEAHPGYPLIGRLRGLAELRGVIAGLQHGYKKSPAEAGL